MSPDRILLDELRRYYAAEQLTVGPNFIAEHVELIADSAERLRSGGGYRPERLVALLRELENDRRHPLHKRIRKKTQRSWVVSDEMFGIFQQLVDVWIQRLPGAVGKTARQILLAEMGTYYLGDELSVTPDFVTEFAEHIADSAKRMKAAAGAQGIDGLVALLRELRENRQHPVFDQISNHTMIGWEDDDEMFAIFQQLTDRWIEALTGANARSL